MFTISKFESFSHNVNQYVLTHKLRRHIKIIIEVDKSLRITKVDYEPKLYIKLPFSVGSQLKKHALENWCCINQFLLDDEDTCPEEKVMGIKVSDIPQGHELRWIYPGKFRKH